MDLIEAQYQWDVLISNGDSAQDFFKSDTFNQIKVMPSCALNFVESYFQDDFEEIFFSFDKKAINSPLLALKYIKNHTFNTEEPQIKNYLSQFLSDSIFAYEAIKLKPEIYNFLNDDLKHDLLIATQLITKNGMFYSLLPISLKKLNKFKSLALQNKNNSGYEALSAEDKSNEKYIEIAQKDIKNYKFLPDKFKIKLKSQIVKNPFLLEFAPQKLLENDDFIKKVLLSDASSLQWAPEKYKKDSTWCSALYYKNKSCLPYISKELFTEDFCLEIFLNAHHQSNEVSRYWENIPPSLQNDDFLKKIIIKSDYAINFASHNLLKDENFLIEMQKIHPSLYVHLPDNIKKDNLVLMKNLCEVIAFNKEDNDTRVTFSIVNVDSFIKKFPMEKYLEIRTHLIKKKHKSFNDLLADLKNYSLEQKLGQSLPEKTDYVPKKVKL